MMAASSEDGNDQQRAARAPSPPGDDASPFMLPVYLTRGSKWRSLREPEPGMRPIADEFHLYVWRSTTLRSLAHMIHAAAPGLSQSHTPHAFRLIFWSRRRREYVGEEVAVDVTRVAPDDVANKLSAISRRALAAAIEEQPSSKDGLKTLSDIGYHDGDFLECLIPRPPPANSWHAREGQQQVDARAVSPPPRLRDGRDGRGSYESRDGRAQAAGRRAYGAAGAGAARTARAW